MSQTQSNNNRAARRAREREERKQAKRLATSEAKALSTVPTTNNKKKHKKSTVVPSKFMTSVPTIAKNSVPTKSPCAYIMVSSASAPSVSVKANYDPVVVAELTAKPELEGSAVKMSAPQEEETQEEKIVVGGADSVVADESSTTAQPEPSSEANTTHSSKHQLNVSPAYETSSETNKSHVTLVGNEEQKDMQSPPSPPKKSTDAQHPANKILPLNGKSGETKSSNVLDLFKKVGTTLFAKTA